MLILRNKQGQLSNDDGGPALDDGRQKHWVLDGRLHRIDGPAVMTASGTQQFWWKGINIPLAMWASRKSAPPQEILAIANAELRRCMIDMRGWEIFIESLKPEVIHKDEKRQMALYKVPLPEPEPEAAHVLQVVDATDVPGVGRRKYFIRVNPKHKTCLDAVADSFRCTAAQYKEMEVET